MKKGILARKVGMTQVFDEAGRSIPVTVLEAGPCTVISKRDPEKDGYQALQIGFKPAKESRLNNPQKGHFKKAGVKPLKYIRELRLASTAEYEVGQEIKADIFAPGEFVDVTGVSRGKGFAGSIKRHGQSRSAMTHGSHYHRGPGSLGGVDAARVFKGQSLPGRMGGEKVTVQKLEVIKATRIKIFYWLKALCQVLGAGFNSKNSVKVS